MSEVKRLRWNLSMQVDEAQRRRPNYPWIAKEVADFEAAVRAEEREAIAASCEAQAAVCATPARGGAYRHCARMARDVTARVSGRGGGG